VTKATNINNIEDASSLEERIDALATSPDLMLEELVLDVTGEICDTMDQQGVTKSELARRIGVKPPHVTRILQGEDNFTLKTLTRIAHALNRAVRLTLAPADSTTHFVHSVEGSKESIRVSSSTSKRSSFRSRDFGRSVSFDDIEETNGKAM
jgi:transcriptional regulator with XRE-family HTH domain